MNLLDDVEVEQQPSKASLSKQATNLIGRRRTRRAKKKKKVKPVKWQREFSEAMKAQKKVKKQLAQHWQEATRLMAKD